MNFHIDFTIDDWFYWGTEYLGPKVVATGEKRGYELSDIPSLQRRRLPEVAKRLHRFTQNLANEKTPLIYASYNGEISQTLSIIRSFSDDVSPAKFSLSVHNAIAGLLSVIHKNSQSYQAIDSLSGLIETAVVEAMGLLTQHKKVGIIYYDETLPTELVFTDDNEVATTQVLALTLTGGQGYRLEKTVSPNQQPLDEITTEFTHIHGIADFLQGKEKHLLNRYANTTWQWSRDVC